MFESLKAANNAKLTLAKLKGPSAPSSHRAWSCDIMFEGQKVGSASGDDLRQDLKLDLDNELPGRIIAALKSNGFALDLSKKPRDSIQPDTPANFMRLAIAQIADEMDLVKELKVSARTQTLVLMRSDPTKVAVFKETYSEAVKERLVAQYGDELMEVVNESLKGL
ncbi:TPA: hypothetical protein N2C61_002090 [Pseudomonas aeruginosa]|nr:hypothetical protein [Pseudomonas aeruginosa]